MKSNKIKRSLNRWDMYEFLKKKEEFSESKIKEIENIPATELREGVIEFLLNKHIHCTH